MVQLQRFLLASACAGALGVSLCAQTSASLSSSTHPVIQAESYEAYAVDVNNDGYSDVIRTFGSGSAGFGVSIANGDGTFKAEVSYVFPGTLAQNAGEQTMGWGDFNGDGKLDLAFPIFGSNTLLVYLGNGDGTFQAARQETATLPDAGTFVLTQVAVADYNGDGHRDLVIGAAGHSGGAPMVLLPGNGDGTFGTGTAVFTNPNFDYGISVAPGDFDGDGKADVAFIQKVNCSKGGCDYVLHIDYGDGKGGFTDTVESNVGTPAFAVGDVNSDSRTDIFTVGFSPQELVTLYGQSNRTFTMYTYPVSNPINVGMNAALAMADLNGDGLMDLVGVHQGTNSLSFEVFLNANSQGVFSEESVPVPNYYYATTPLVGNFNDDTKPDVVYAAYQNSTQLQSAIVEELNTTKGGNWGPCSYPSKGQGFSSCMTTGSTIQFGAMADSFGQLRKIELWVDGAKVGEQWHTWGQRAWFSMSKALAAGTHKATYYAADVDGRLQRHDFSFSVPASGCTSPSSAGVHVCSPTNGSTVSSPVQVSSAATVTGTIARMEVWVDGVKKFSTSRQYTLSTSIPLAAGSHRFDYYAVNTAGQKWEKTVYATVK